MQVSPLFFLWRVQILHATLSVSSTVRVGIVDERENSRTEKKVRETHHTRLIDKKENTRLEISARETVSPFCSW